MSGPAGPRWAKVERRTGETAVCLSVSTGASGEVTASTGVGFLDHLIGALAKWAGWSLQVTVAGDATLTGPHHVAEDVGLALGEALRALLWGPGPVPAGESAPGVVRFGEALTPMDESLVLTALDISGRPLARLAGFDDLRVAGEGGEFGGQDWEAFCGGLALGGLLTLHQRVVDGRDPHHLLEAAAKGLGRALSRACLPIEAGGGRGQGTSTKGRVQLEVTL